VPTRTHAIPAISRFGFRLIAGNKNKRTADRMQVSYLPFCTLNRHFGGVPPLRGLVVDGELFGSFGLYVGRKAVVLNGCYGSNGYIF
jgi:hypothetical protein